jgi:hypothetical protein
MHLPESVWRGFFAEYRDAVANQTSAPDAFHFAAATAVVGAALGRRMVYYSPNPVYANQYALVLGPTAQKKSTANKLGIQLLVPGEVCVVSGLSTREGLVNKLRKEEGTSVLLYQDEFTYILSKMRQEHAAALGPMLNELYDCPDVAEVMTRGDALYASNPTISFLSSSTEDGMLKLLGPEHAANGLLNRFCYYMGEGKPWVPKPPRPELGKLAKRVSKMSEPHRHGSSHWNREIVLSPEAYALWCTTGERWQAAGGLDETLQFMLARLSDHVIKIAMLYAGCENTKAIMLDQLKAALAWGDYQEEVVTRIFGGGALGPGREEGRLLNTIQTLGGDVSMTQLHRHIGGRVSSTYLRQMLTGLEHMGRVHRYSDGRTQWVKLVKEEA